jgi:hypothetical protein
MDSFLDCISGIFGRLLVGFILAATGFAIGWLAGMVQGYI